MLYVHYSHFLWSISHPGKKGTTTFDLSEDSEACVTSSSPANLPLERVITKLFSHYQIFEITDTVRHLVRVKLWRMGQTLSKLGGSKRQQQLANWKDGSEATWNFEINQPQL